MNGKPDAHLLVDGRAGRRYVEAYKAKWKPRPMLLNVCR
jgi:hypothetical protein